MDLDLQLDPYPTSITAILRTQVSFAGSDVETDSLMSPEIAVPPDADSLVVILGYHSIHFHDCSGVNWWSMAATRLKVEGEVFWDETTNSYSATWEYWGPVEIPLAGFQDTTLVLNLWCKSYSAGMNGSALTVLTWDVYDVTVLSIESGSELTSATWAAMKNLF